MTSISRTAYPMLSRAIATDELLARYALSPKERSFVTKNARGSRGRLMLAAMLKTRQALGYFISLNQVTYQVIETLASQLNIQDDVWQIDDEHLKKTLYRYRGVCRKFLASTPFSEQSEQRIIKSIRHSALTMSDPADLINVAIEELTMANIELPAFSTLDRIAGHERQQVHDQLYTNATKCLMPEQRQILDSLLVIQRGCRITEFARMKQTPGPATLQHFRLWAERLIDLDQILDPKPFLTNIAHTKVRQFSAEAEAYEIGDMRSITTEAKRHTLLLCLLHSAQSKTRDEIIDMFLRRMRRVKNSAKCKLKELQEKHQELEESLISVLRKVLQEAKNGEPTEVLGSKINHVFDQHGGIDALSDQVSRVSAYHDDNYFPLLWPKHATNRAVILRVLDQIEIRSATQDNRLLVALDFIRKHRTSRKECLELSLDLRFMSVRWQSFVKAKSSSNGQVNRRSFEVAVFMYLAEALEGGDLYVEDSEAYSDYRQQLLPWAQCQEKIDNYCFSLKLPTTSKLFVAGLREQLTEIANKIDMGFPKNSEFSIDSDGVPHLKRLATSTVPENLEAFKKEVYGRMPERHLLDILKYVQYWSNYTKHFRPPSDSESKIADPMSRYLFTVFGFGCNLGASQTARHAPHDIHRQTLRRINLKHINGAKLEAALADVIEQYSRFDLPKYWGGSHVAIADGTHIALRKNNMLGEQHIRYGDYGGIAYHHISGEYIALFSHFISCGVWEAVYILDALLLNKSVYQPDTLHADTHGQSEPVFALSHLLGIKLFPRMRTWNDVTFYRPHKKTKYKHIDSLFGKAVDWELIETHWQDMMQVVLSIQAGKVLPSMLLRKLNSNNRKNKLYRAFRELGRVNRTLFLLRYVSESEFRQTIRAETTKVESYNDFTDWITFGGELIKSGDPVEQSKQIKYTDLVANAIMLHNVVDLTGILNDMVAEGTKLSKKLVAGLSPFIRDQIRRFGRYHVDMDESPPELSPISIKISD